MCAGIEAQAKNPPGSQKPGKRLITDMSKISEPVVQKIETGKQRKRLTPLLEDSNELGLNSFAANNSSRSLAGD